MNEINIAYENCLKGINFQENFDLLLNKFKRESVIGLAYKIENLSYSNLKRIEDFILELKRLSYSYEFAKRIEIADVKAHQEIIINSNDMFYIYLFARDVKNSDKQLLSDIILDLCDNGTNDVIINKFYDNVDFDKSKYDSYFRNLIFK